MLRAAERSHWSGPLARLRLARVSRQVVRLAFHDSQS